MDKALLKELLQLSPAERMELAHELLESIPQELQPPLTPGDGPEPAGAIQWEELRTSLGSRRK